MSAPWPVSLVVSIGAVVALAIGVLGVVAPAGFFALIGHSGEPVSDLTRQLAAYAGSRDLVLGLALLILLFRRSRYLPIVVILFAAGNLVDAVDALVFQRWAQFPGALLVGVLFYVVGLWLLRQGHSPRTT